MRAKQIVLSRLLPKTGQTTAFHDYDDGYYEAGWWRGLLRVNNYERFVESTINGEAIITDRATGLIWPKDFNEAGWRAGVSCFWETALDWANNLVFAGFNDWRIPNIKELMSLIRPDLYNPALDPIFTNQMSNAALWSSTTKGGLTIYALIIYTNQGNKSWRDKTLSAHTAAIRGGL